VMLSLHCSSFGLIPTVMLPAGVVARRERLAAIFL
jgi:hypothetical protein